MPADTNGTPEPRRTQPMLSSVHFKNYRSLEDYKVENLHRINLFVGKNNAGKTSILEGLNILVSSGEPVDLTRINRVRGEARFESLPQSPREAGDLFADVGQLFFRRSIGVREVINIRGCFFDSSQNAVKFSVEEMDEKCDLTFFESDGTSTVLPYQLVIEFKDEHENKFESRLPLNKFIELSRQHAWRFSSQKWGPRERYYKETNIDWIGAESLNNSSLSRYWRKMILGNEESVVVNSLNVLVPAVKDLQFIPQQNSEFLGQGAGFLVGFNNSSERVPLGSLGDGVRRMLAIVLALSWCRGSTLFIDEVDTGLHYSVMPDFWRVIVETAKRFNVQIFATTHSLDCLRGLAYMCEEHPELGKEIAVHKLDRRLTQAVTFFSDEIQTAIEASIEVR